MRDEGYGPAMIAMIIDQNGRFRAEGLRPGKWTLNHLPEEPGGGLMLLRIEREGVPITDAFEIGTGEQVTGLRITFGKGTSVIRGRVAVIGGTLPEGASLSVVPHRIGSPRQLETGLGQTDARGFFVLEGLVPGQYELEAKISFQFSRPPEWRRRLPTAKEIVTLANGQTLEVELTIDLRK
jgi:hypothetical protein